MYIIKADDTYVIHDGLINDRDYVAVAGTMRTEFNRAGTLSFTVPYNNDAYKNNRIKKLKTIIKVYDKKNNLKWKGRVLDTSRDFYHRMTYNCEGWLSVLNDSIIRPPSGNGWDKDKGKTANVKTVFEELIALHNSEVDNYKQLTTDVQGFNNATATFPYPNYETTLDYIQSNFVGSEDVGGRIWVTNSTIHFYSDNTEQLSTQSITFGQNLLDLVEAHDAAEVYTVLIPVGKDGLLLSSTPGSDFVYNQNGINSFGRIVRMQEFSEIASVNELRTKAQETLDKNIEDSFSIEATAFDLGLVNSDAGTIEVGTFATVYSPPHNLSKGYICTAAEVDLCNPANTKYTLGVNPDTLTTKQIKLTKTVAANARYADENTKYVMDLGVYQNRVTISGTSTFYRSGNSVYLSFSITLKADVLKTSASVMTFNNKYAPAQIVNSMGAYDETSDKELKLRITTDGKIQIFDVEDDKVENSHVVTGNIVWTFTG